MKKIFCFILLCSYSSIGYPADICSSLSAAYENDKITILSETKPTLISRSNWKMIDVINSFPYECKISQVLIQFKNETYVVFKTEDDSCDGGNTYGVIYTPDLKTPIAHIYDGYAYCKSDWRKEYLSQNHICDVKAEEIAKTEMDAFGFKFEDLNSMLELRDGYIYSSIKVSGKIQNKDNREATVNVLMNLNNCDVGGVEIDSIILK